MEFKFIPKDKIENLPKETGVYCFKKETTFIYIGKAGAIRHRVR